MLREKREAACSMNELEGQPEGLGLNSKCPGSPWGLLEEGVMGPEGLREKWLWLLSRSGCVHMMARVLLCLWMGTAQTGK